MSEFQLAGNSTAGSSRSGPQGQHGGQVEWYQAGANTYPSTGTDYSFEAPSGYISTSDNFTDEAPLLEGEACKLAAGSPRTRKRNLAGLPGSVRAESLAGNLGCLPQGSLSLLASTQADGLKHCASSYGRCAAGLQASLHSATDSVPCAELGIDISGILKKSKGILAGRFSSADIEELDMGGPLVFAALLACAHVLVRPHTALGMAAWDHPSRHTHRPFRC